MIDHVNTYLDKSPIIGYLDLTGSIDYRLFGDETQFNNSGVKVIYEVRELFNDGHNIRPVITLRSPYNDSRIYNLFRFDVDYTDEIRLLGELFSIDILNVPKFN